MSKKPLLIFVFLNLLFSINIIGKNLKLTDLTNLLNKKSWEEVNQFVLPKGWTYYDSEKGYIKNSSLITWSFNKDYYTDEAQAWFYLYTYEGTPNKIVYSIFNKESYLLIQNTIALAGFKLDNSDVKRNEIISNYSNSNFILKITTEKIEKDDDYSGQASITGYHIVLIKKFGIYDIENGKKKEYYDNNVVQIEYTLLNGKLNGQLKAFYKNGNLKKIGNYSNGLEDGLFKEYDEYGSIETEYSMSKGKLNGIFKGFHSNGKVEIKGNFLHGEKHGMFTEYDEFGNIEIEYSMLNGKKNGIVKVYENGKIVTSTFYKQDLKNGQNIIFHYNKESGNLEFKEVGDYLEDKKNGEWKVFHINDGSQELLILNTYSLDKKNGSFQNIQGDSLIFGSYSNDVLHGEYKVYYDVLRSVIGGVIRTDTSMMSLISIGNYSDGLAFGYWSNYDFARNLISEGGFKNDKKHGVWKYYYSKTTDSDGNELNYSRKIYLTQEYEFGLLNGKSIRYSYLNKVQKPCSGIKANSDTCYKFVYEKVLYTQHYKNDKLEGVIEFRDSDDELVVKGYYKNGLKDGVWVERYREYDFYENEYYIYLKGSYIKDKRDGKWLVYNSDDRIIRTYSFKEDKYNGEYIQLNLLGQPIEKKWFEMGKLKELTVYDSATSTPTVNYVIYDEKLYSYKCRKTEYLGNIIKSQEYWFNKEGEIDHNLFEITFFMATDTLYGNSSIGYKDGEYKLTDDKHKPIVVGKIYKNDSIGLWEFYNYNQNIKVEYYYIKNKIQEEKYFNLNGESYSGQFIIINEQSKIKEIRNVKNGLRNGTTTFIDMNTNKKIKKEKYKNGKLK